MRSCHRLLRSSFGTLLLLLAFAGAGAPGLAAPADAPAGRRPNVVIILGDDLGFADMGSFGGEIRTPNLDSLAKEGVRFTNFYTHASCSPTRSLLLSGVETHLNGLGNMDEWTAPNQVGVDGYEGYLNKNVATLPEVLKGAGYPETYQGHELPPSWAGPGARSWPARPIPPGHHRTSSPGSSSATARSGRETGSSAG